MLWQTRFLSMHRCRLLSNLSSPSQHLFPANCPRLVAEALTPATPTTNTPTPLVQLMSDPGMQEAMQAMMADPAMQQLMQQQMSAMLATPEGQAQMQAMLEQNPMYQRWGAPF